MRARLVKSDHKVAYLGGILQTITKELADLSHAVAHRLWMYEEVRCDFAPATLIQQP